MSNPNSPANKPAPNGRAQTFRLQGLVNRMARGMLRAPLLCRLVEPGAFGGAEMGEQVTLDPGHGLLDLGGHLPAVLSERDDVAAPVRQLTPTDSQVATFQYVEDGHQHARVDAEGVLLGQTARSACVGDRRAARMAGSSPARAPMMMAAARPPAHASGGMTTASA